MSGQPPVISREKHGQPSFGCTTDATASPRQADPTRALDTLLFETYVFSILVYTRVKDVKKIVETQEYKLKNQIKSKQHDEV